MTLSEKIDAAILIVITVWAIMDRCNVYLRRK